MHHIKSNLTEVHADIAGGHPLLPQRRLQHHTASERKRASSSLYVPTEVCADSAGGHPLPQQRLLQQHHLPAALERKNVSEAKKNPS